MRIKLGIIAAGYVLSLSAVAGTMGSQIPEYKPWSVIGSLGYTWYKNAYNGNQEGGVDYPHQDAIGNSPYAAAFSNCSS